MQGGIISHSETGRQELTPDTFIWMLNVRSSHLMLRILDLSFCAKTISSYTDGPELERAPFIQGVTLGEPVLILFGYHLKSNPRPNLRWRRPPDEIPDQPGYRYILNQEKVGINIECMSIADIGGWHGILSVTTYDNPLNRSDGSLHQFHGSYLVDSEGSTIHILYIRSPLISMQEA